MRHDSFGVESNDGLKDRDGSWNLAVSYEQLLTILHHQHALAIQHKDAEVANMQTCVDMMTGGMSQDERQLAVALQLKDEEAALAMAAKHKELELIASLLQLREQQIEDFRQVCEAQRNEIDELRRRVVQADAVTVDNPHDGGMLAPLHARDVEPPRITSSKELTPANGDHEKLRREMVRLRLRMEEMESTIGEQRDQHDEYSRTLDAKSERVDQLERQLRGVQSPRSSIAESAIAHPQEQHRSHRQRTPLAEAGSAALDADAAWTPSTTCRTLDILTPTAAPPSAKAEGDLNSVSPACSGVYRSARRIDGNDVGEHRFNFGTPRHEICARPRTPTSSAAERIAMRGSDFERGVSGKAGPSTVSQSHEVGREITRLRMQLGELERVATDRHGCGGITAGRAGPSPEAISATPMTSLPSAFAAPPVLPTIQRDSPQWPSQTAVDEPPPAQTSTTSSFRSRSKDLAPLHVESNHRLAGWEYRPHGSDELDAAIAVIVNRPASRYNHLRAMLCRLEPETYLCGSRRMRLSVRDAGGGADAVILASADNGGSWVDLEDALRVG